MKSLSFTVDQMTIQRIIVLQAFGTSFLGAIFKREGTYIMDGRENATHIGSMLRKSIPPQEERYKPFRLALET